VIISLQDKALAAGDSQFQTGLLENAHKTIQAKARKLLNIPEPEPDDPPKTKDTAKPAAKRPAPPPALSGIPAAAPEIVTEPSKFAWLDRIKDPVKYDEALARLSPADLAAYENQ
jgi:hypothetical protein